MDLRFQALAAAFAAFTAALPQPQQTSLSCLFRLVPVCCCCCLNSQLFCCFALGTARLVLQHCHANKQLLTPMSSLQLWHLNCHA